MNIYELEMCDAPEQPHDRSGFLASEHVVLRVTKDMLNKNQNRLIDYVQFKGGRPHMVNRRFPEPTIRALAVLLDLSDQPHLCASNYVEADLSTSRRKKPRNEDGAEAEDEVVVEVNKSWTYVAKSDKGEPPKIMNRIEVYCEPIWDRDEVGVKAWDWHFCIHDESLTFDDGIGNHAFQNAERLKRKGATNAFWQWETTVSQWIREAVSPYAQMRFSTEIRDDLDQVNDARRAFNLPLRDPANPARVNKIYTFDAARANVDVATYCEAQMSADSYFDAADQLIAFPRGARWIPPQMRNPRAILLGLLERPAYAIGVPVDRLESLMSLTVAAEVPQDEDPDVLLKIMSKSFRDLVHTNEDRAKAECVARFTSWVGSDSCPPGIQACWDLCRNFINQPVVPNKTAVVDPTLSPFGNAVCWELLVFENLNDAAYLHTELLFDYINSGGAFRCKRTLRLHTLRPGPPASGKSWELEMLVRLCAPNTTKSVGHQTKRADTTSTNRDCTLRIMDEANEVLSDKGGDGAGLAMFKTILTSGVNFTDTCVVDNELKTRETVEVKSHLLVLLIANTNAEISAFPTSMISRLMVRYIPERRRADMIDPALRDSIAGYSAISEAEIERHQLRHSLVGLVTHAIDVGWFPEVDMDYAVMMLDSVLEDLKKRGVNPDARSKQRLPLYMRALTIWFAVYMVFQTNAHFPPGTPFRPEHLLECVRYLRCTREITYFAITHMYDTLINVNAPVVCKAIKKLVEMQIEEKGMHPKRAKTDKRPGDYDTEWYLLHLPMMGLKDDELLYAGVKLITAAIERDDSVVYSGEMVADTLRWMLTQRVKGSHKAAMRVSRAQFNEVGLVFSVSLIDGDVINHVMDAVKDSMDDWVRETDARYVTGITYREGVEAGEGLRRSNGAPLTSTRMFPHLFRVINAADVPKTNKPFIRRNPAFRERGFNTLFLGTPESENTEEPFLVLRLDLDKKQTADRLAALGLPASIPPVPPHLCNALVGTYPEAMIESHEGRFENHRCRVVVGEAAGATTAAPAAVSIEEMDDDELFAFG